MKTRMNGSYEIINAIRLDKETEVVIGKSDFGYVCWYCKDGNDYYWGEYTDNYDDAYDKYCERIGIDQGWKQLLNSAS